MSSLDADAPVDHGAVVSSPAGPGRRGLLAALFTVSGVLAILLAFTAVLLVSNAIRADRIAAVAASPAPMDSPQAIAKRLDQLGMGCAGLTAVSSPVGASARASCYVYDDQIVISTYASHADVEAQWTMQSGLMAGVSRVDMVIGDTWTIVADDGAYAEQAAKLLRAEYRHS